MPNGIYPNEFTVCYGSGRGDFRVYVTGFIGLACIIFFVVSGEPLGLALALPFLCAAFYFFPLLEKKVPRLGANQYGIFIDGFGLIDWRSIKEIAVKTYAVRSIRNEQLTIELSRSVEQSLIKDWRDVPIYRLLMKLPWNLKGERTIVIVLEPFSVNSEEILSTLRRMKDVYSH